MVPIQSKENCSPGASGQKISSFYLLTGCSPLNLPSRFSPSKSTCMFPHGPLTSHFDDATDLQFKIQNSNESEIHNKDSHSFNNLLSLSCPVNSFTDVAIIMALYGGTCRST